MAKADKDAKELVELAAEQGEHAVKNVGRAAEELLPTLKDRTEGVSLALSMGPKTSLVVGTTLTALGGYKLGKHLWELKKARDAKKELKAEKPVKVVPRPPQADAS